jgi:hypothetical protein
MTRFTFQNFLKDLGMRIGAAAVVLGVFFGLGYVKRKHFLGLSTFLDSRLGFFAAGFIVIGVIAAAWIIFQQLR